jgi:hypothetical protein
MLRQNLERKVGRAPIEHVVGKDVKDNIGKYIEVVEHLQAYKGRGETGRVMTALTQGTMFNKYAAAMGLAAAGGYLANSDWAQDTGLLGGAIFLLGPLVASRYLTSPRAKDYIKYVKAAGSSATTPMRMRKLTRDLMEGVVDNKVATRLLGRGLEKWGALPGDQEILNALQETALGTRSAELVGASGQTVSQPEEMMGQQ